jgi:hypothetical protein
MFTRVSTAVLLSALFCLESGARAQVGVSDESANIERCELSIALNELMEDSSELREKLSAAHFTIKELRRNLASAVGEAEVFKRKTAELNKRIEALGPVEGDGDMLQVEERLMAAVGSLQSIENEKQELSEALVRILETAKRFAVPAGVDESVLRVDLEAEIRNANRVLGILSRFSGNVNGPQSTLADGMVISVKDDLSLVVANLGLRQGLKIGMPFIVTRENQTVATIKIVDVRERIAAGVVQEYGSNLNFVRPGDRLAVDTQ